jgi:hypothetical protein
VQVYHTKASGVINSCILVYDLCPFPPQAISQHHTPFLHLCVQDKCQVTFTPPLHHSNAPSTNFHTPLLVLYSSRATVPSGNRISLLFKFTSVGLSKKAFATSACSCFEKAAEGLYGGGIWRVCVWRESAVKQAGQCLEGRVKERM